MMSDQKSKKHRIPDALVEGLLEVVFSLVFLAIGAVVLAVFGVALDGTNVDYDLVILVGIAVFFSIFGIISYIKNRIISYIKNRRKSAETISKK